MLNDIKEIRETLAMPCGETALLSEIRPLPCWSDHQRRLLHSIAAISGTPTDCGDHIIFTN